MAFKMPKSKKEGRAQGAEGKIIAQSASKKKNCQTGLCPFVDFEKGDF
jgi:hypothetical protein